MTDNIAFQEMYRQESVAIFDTEVSLLRDKVTTESRVNGLTAIFNVTDRAEAARTRGADGKIPNASVSQDQPKATLTEAHWKNQITRFNIMTAQSDQRAVRIRQGATAINHYIDDTIYEALDTTTTIFPGGPSTLTEAQALQIVMKMYENRMPNDGGLFWQVTPAMWSQMTQWDSFNDADKIEASNRLTEGGPPTSAVSMKKWQGACVFMDPRGPGAGSADASSYLWHRSAMGHAIGQDVTHVAGYDEEDDYSYFRHSVDQGAVLLFNEGVIKYQHNDTAVIPSF